LFRSEDLHPAGAFARDFLYSINIAGFLSLSFLFYNLVRPYVFRFKHDEAEREIAREIVKMHGRSGMDHFKTSPDKLLFFNPGKDAFLAYRVAGNYAVVLEDPVSRGEETMKNCIRDFDRFCRDNGLKSFYYRVPEESLKIYVDLKKKHMLFGQEAVVNLESFSLEGRAMKGIRNSCNKARESGFNSRFYHPPVSEELLTKLKDVSDEWLEYTGYKEIVFSQGRFDHDELRDHPILTI
jgi:phosphatidylglycerol lysyltransferase